MFNKVLCHPDVSTVALAKVEPVEGYRRCSADGPLGQGRDGSTALTMTGGGKQPTTDLSRQRRDEHGWTRIRFLEGSLSAVAEALCRPG